MHADRRHRRGRMPVVDVVEVDHRPAAVRVALAAGGHAGLAADAAAGIDEQRRSHHRRSLRLRLPSARGARWARRRPLSRAGHWRVGRCPAGTGGDGHSVISSPPPTGRHTPCTRGSRRRIESVDSEHVRRHGAGPVIGDEHGIRPDGLGDEGRDRTPRRAGSQPSPGSPLAKPSEGCTSTHGRGVCSTRPPSRRVWLPERIVGDGPPGRQPERVLVVGRPRLAARHFTAWKRALPSGWEKRSSNEARRAGMVELGAGPEDAAGLPRVSRR